MAQPSKVFKVKREYRLIYNAIYEVLNIEKSPLLKAMLIEELGEDEAKKLNQHTFNSLLTSMIDSLIKQNYKNKDHMTISEKMSDIYAITDQIIENHNLIPISFRLEQEVINRIYSFQPTKLGEVIEMAIINFINDIDDDVLALVKRTLLYTE